LAINGAVRSDHLSDLVADAHDWVKGSQCVLPNDPDPGTSHLAELTL
jgi:hypothetical protein